MIEGYLALDNAKPAGRQGLNNRDAFLHLICNEYIATSFLILLLGSQIVEGS